MHTKKEVFERLIAPLHLQLALSGKFYQNYLETKNFQSAETLRTSNRKVVQLVLDNAALIPLDIKDDILELINHYEHWFTQFRIHKKKVKPGPADRFVFKSAIDHFPFPVNAEEKINLYYSEIKKQLAAEMLVEE